jgi:hypothetical protein
MSQIARNLTDLEDGILTGKRYLIHDRDPLFTAEFLSTITATYVLLSVPLLVVALLRRRPLT